MAAGWRATASPSAQPAAGELPAGRDQNRLAESAAASQEAFLHPAVAAAEVALGPVEVASEVPGPAVEGPEGAVEALPAVEGPEGAVEQPGPVEAPEEQPEPAVAVPDPTVAAEAAASTCPAPAAEELLAAQADNTPAPGGLPTETDLLPVAYCLSAKPWYRRHLGRSLSQSPAKPYLRLHYRNTRQSFVRAHLTLVSLSKLTQLSTSGS